MPPPDTPKSTGAIQRTPDTPTLDARDLVWLIRCYIESCRERLDHKITVNGYEYQLNWFIDWWEVEGPGRDWLLRPDDFLRFERYLRTAVSAATKKPISYHTRHTIVKRLREMFGWALQHGYVDRDYAKWVPAAYGSKPVRKAARIGQLHKLLAVAGIGPGGQTHRDTLRNRAIVAMLMGMGLRRAELCKITIERIVLEQDNSGYVPVVGKRTKANTTGKRDAAFDAATGAIIVEYLVDCGRKSGPLFLGKRGTPLTPQGVYKVVKGAIERAGLSAQMVGPHDLRYAFATHYRRTRKSQNSADLLQMQLGHANASQTNEYTLLEIDDIRADIVSPIALFAEFPEDE